MSRELTACEVAEYLLEKDDIVILTHQYPDGDTLGSALALCRALHMRDKRARIECADVIPEKYDYLFENLTTYTFEPKTVVAVDVADEKLLGSLEEVYGGRIDLCIDHHGSNTRYAANLLLKPDYAAAAMVVYEVIGEMLVPVYGEMAEAIYTGIATDTGCFKYANTDSYTHRIAADIMEGGHIRTEMINRTMFDIKSRARVELERRALAGMTFYCGDRVAVMPITLDMIKESNAFENDMEGLAPLPRQIEGVWVGITMREKPNGEFKISVRTGNHADASAICKELGGGGHIRAAGCSINKPLDEAIDILLDTIKRVIPRIAQADK